MCKDNLTDNYFVGFGINLQRCGESSIDSVSNKICVITGATDGIGKRTAEVLAQKGFNLGIVGRNKKKGRALVKDIFEKTGNEKIHYFNANLLLMSEVKRVASEIKEKFEKMITETETAYMKILESSQTLLIVLEREKDTFS